MSILGWIIIGGIAGWLAGQLMGTAGQQGCLVDILLGIFGGILGGLLFGWIAGVGITGFNLWSLFVAFIGAVILIAVIRVFRKAGDSNPPG